MNHSYTAPFGPIQILHEDADLMVVVKPPGLLSVPGRGVEKADCLSARLAALTVHRLDMETSGLMVFARHAAAHAALSKQFEARTVDKIYVALVAGVIEDQQGDIDLPLITDWPQRPLQKICHDMGKPSLTRWTVLERGSHHSRLALQPITGRSHQLRVHLASIGHPILGDSLYAPEAVQAAAPRMLLHAERLACDHPGTGQRMSYQAPAPF